MIDLATEQPITLSAAARICPGRPHVATVWRWAQTGVHGALLETIAIGGRRFTTAEAIQRFIAATTAAMCPQSAPIARTPHQRQRDIDRAKAELAAEGI